MAAYADHVSVHVFNKMSPFESRLFVVHRDCTIGGLKLLVVRETGHPISRLNVFQPIRNGGSKLLNDTDLVEHLCFAPVVNLYYTVCTPRRTRPRGPQAADPGHACPCDICEFYLRKFASKERGSSGGGVKRPLKRKRKTVTKSLPVTDNTSVPSSPSHP